MYIGCLCRSWAQFFSLLLLWTIIITRFGDINRVKKKNKYNSIKIFVAFECVCVCVFYSSSIRYKIWFFLPLVNWMCDGIEEISHMCECECVSMLWLVYYCLFFCVFLAVVRCLLHPANYKFINCMLRRITTTAHTRSHTKLAQLSQPTNQHIHSIMI